MLAIVRTWMCIARIAGSWLAAAMATAGLCSLPANAQTAEGVLGKASPSVSARTPPAPRTSAHIFFSGHSLTDNPLPEDVAKIAHSLGTSARWNQQNIPGSSLKKRTRGNSQQGGEWAGYRQGKNREGEGMDVVRELRQPKTLGGERYDTLLITEGHWLVDSLLGVDTVRYLRHFHDRLIEGHPEGRTHFYASWLDLSDKDSPGDWIAYERAAAPVWACISTRINQSLAAEGRSDRITPLPAASALAALVERATQQAGVPGITGRSVSETVNRLFKDDVHLTRLGIYYMALVTYAHVYGRSPRGAWAPSEVNDAQARALQDVAWEVVAPLHSGTNLDLGQCRVYLRDSFCGTYYRYIRQAYWSNPRSTHHRSAVSARLKQLKETTSCRMAFGRGDSGNPFVLSREHDRSYWHAPP